MLGWHIRDKMSVTWHITCLFHDHLSIVMSVTWHASCVFHNNNVFFYLPFLLVGAYNLLQSKEQIVKTNHWPWLCTASPVIYPVIAAYDLTQSNQCFVLRSLVTMTWHIHISLSRDHLLLWLGMVTSVFYPRITGCDFAQSHQYFILWLGSHISNLCYNHWLWLCTVTSGFYPMITGCDLAKSHQYFILWLNWQSHQ